MNQENSKIAGATSNKHPQHLNESSCSSDVPLLIVVARENIPLLQHLAKSQRNSLQALQDDRQLRFKRMRHEQAPSHAAA